MLTLPSGDEGICVLWCFSSRIGMYADVEWESDCLCFTSVKEARAKLPYSWFGDVAYRLALPPKLSSIHPVFHVLMLRKYISDPSYVLKPQEVELSENLTYKEYPVAIVDRQVRQLHTRDIPTVKVLWSNHTVEDYAWETEAMMQMAYPYLFHSWFVPPLLIKFEDEFL